MSVGVYSDTIELSTKGNSDMLDITDRVKECLERGKCRNGQVVLFVTGSTAALTTIEYEPGLKKDFPLALEKIAPRSGYYHHTETWHDDNGHSHVRASLIGPSLTIPVVEGSMPLGTWQQIVLLDFDTRPRHRTVTVQFTGTFS